jgi:predicted transposase YbfD/YdcC
MCGVGWFWLLRWLMEQISETIAPVQYQWVLSGPIAEGEATLELQTLITVRPDWATETSYQESLYPQVSPTEIGSRLELEPQPAVVIHAVSPAWRLVETQLTALRPASEPNRTPVVGSIGEGQTQPSETEPGQTATPGAQKGAEPPAVLTERLPSGVGSIRHHFVGLEDPRVERTKRHQLLDMVTLAICAVSGGADNWVEVENFGRAKLAWFQQFLELPNGIPAHDTFGRVFARLDSQQFESCFLEWIEAVREITSGQIIALDGKTLRRSHDKTIGKGAIHMVSAWASANRLVLGQMKVDEKSNEITAIPKLLAALAISGCIVTIDAMGCQKKIAQQIIEQKADYVLAVKENQGNLYEDIKELFAYAHEINFEGVNGWDYHQTVDKGHGRIEIRECWTLTDPEFLVYLRNQSAWVGLHTLAMVKAERRVRNQTSCEVRYYISSLPGQAEPVLDAVRSHWEIENQVHWILDVAFREDESRIRKGNGAQNFAIIRHIALNLLKHENTAKCGIKAKRLKAGWDENYLLKVLADTN